MPRVRPLLALLVVFTAACEGCPPDGDVSTLRAAFSVTPAAVEVSPLWAGHPRTLTLRVESQGEAPLLSLTTQVEDETGPVDVTASLDGDALAPGGSLPLTVVLSAPPESAGGATASIVVDAGSDGRVVVPVSAAVLRPPSCDDGNPCTDDRFNPTTGACAHDIRADGASCDDGSACTSGDACLAGRCVGEAVQCGDGVECTLDVCDPAVGCVYEPQPARCADEDPCTDDVCTPFSGCSNPPLEEGALCHFAGCAEIGLCFAGACVITEVPDGMPCEDGDACTAGDTCQGGECTSGVPLGVGAAPPLLLDPEVSTLDLCLGPTADVGCFGLVSEPGLERVLAADRDGESVRVVWQGGYVDSYGARCDPSDPLYEPIANMPPGEPPPEYDAGPGNGGALPASQRCAAGVYLTTLSLGALAPPPTTVQLTSVRGPAAAAFVPDEASWGASGAPDSNEPPPPPLPDMGAVVIAYPDRFRSALWIEHRDEQGEAVSSPGRGYFAEGTEGTALDKLALAVTADEDGVFLAFHAPMYDWPGSPCADPGCEASTGLLMLWSKPRFSIDPTFLTMVRVTREIDEACDGLPSGPKPILLHDLQVSRDEQVPRVSFRMSRSFCGDAAPGALGVPEPWRMAAYAFVVDEELLAATSTIVAPLPWADGSEPLSSLRVTADGAAVALRHIPSACDCAAVCPPADEDSTEECVCVPDEATCFETVVERLPSVYTAAPEVLLTSAGHLRGQVAPLVFEGELRVATLLSPHMELLGTDEDGALSRIVAPAPDDGFEWDLSAPLFPGPPESEVVVGRGRSTLEPVFPSPRRALVQVFGCGLGEASVEGACLEDGDCEAGLGCDHSVCLPGPGCAASNTCGLCWGRCVEPAGADGGVLDDAGSDDAGSDDAGSDDAGLADDGGALDDAGDALEDAGVADGG